MSRSNRNRAALPEVQKAAEAGVPADEDSPPKICAKTRAWIAAELAKAELEERLGPDSMGWRDSESKREEFTTHAEFLRRLTKGIEHLD